MRPGIARTLAVSIKWVRLRFDQLFAQRVVPRLEPLSQGLIDVLWSLGDKGRIDAAEGLESLQGFGRAWVGAVACRNAAFRALAGRREDASIDFQKLEQRDRWLLAREPHHIPEVFLQLLHTLALDRLAVKHVFRHRERRGQLCDLGGERIMQLNKFAEAMLHGELLVAD